MATIANRYSSFDSNSKYLAHLYWEDYKLVLDMRQVPIELVFFLEDCIMSDTIFRQNPNFRCYNLFVLLEQATSATPASKTASNFFIIFRPFIILYLIIQKK